MPSFSQPNAQRMGAQQRDNMMRFAGDTATVWAYISAAGGIDVAGFAPTAFSAGRTITAQFYVARGFLPNVEQHQSPAGMIPAGTFLMNIIGYKPSVNDVIEYQRTAYRVESEAWREPLIKDNYVVTVKRAGT